MGIRVQPREIEIPSDDPFKNDLRGRREAVDTLTHLVGNLDGPCAIALDAEWGFGKTTFLSMWSLHLRNREFPVLAFNAWETDFSDDPFLTLSTELTKGLQSSETKLPGEMIETLKGASREVLRWVAPSAIRFAASQVPLVGAQLGEAGTAFAGERLSRYSKSRTSVERFRTVLRDTAVALSEANGNRPLMVMIDELDRCRPSYAVELLEVAKHFFSVDRIVFVLAVNRDQLAQPHTRALRDLRPGSALNRDTLQGVRMAQRRNHERAGALRPRQQVRQTEKGHLALPAQKRLEKNPQQVKITPRPNVYFSAIPSENENAANPLD